MSQAKFICIASRHFWRIIRIERRYLRVFLALFTFMCIVSVGTTVFARIGFTAQQLPNDPFLDYTDVFPGQFRNAMLARRFSCHEATDLHLQEMVEACSNFPHTGPFSEVKVAVSDGIIGRLDFNIRDNALRLGDLVLWWRKSDFELDRAFVILTSPHRMLVTLWQSPGEHFTYHSPISRVSFVLVTEGQTDPPLQPQYFTKSAIGSDSFTAAAPSQRNIVARPAPF